MRDRPDRDALLAIARETLLKDLLPQIAAEHRMAALMVARGGVCAILGGVSRLVIDYNREPDAAGLVPVQSDGHHIEGNSVAEVADRLTRFYDPYHEEVARLREEFGDPQRALFAFTRDQFDREALFGDAHRDGDWPAAEEDDNDFLDGW